MSNRRKIDLDAARRARSELTPDAEPPVVTIGGKDYELPEKLPAAVIVGMARAARKEIDGFVEAIEGLFGANTSAVLAAGLELEDVNAILESVYGDGDDDEGTSAAGE